ncbi:MAG: hypothetical protein R6U20_03330 [Longimonas sp.]|uniref:hypothetical protein n=1 Tax=Longimonas sp. TaxID=2039626 RepID=UPI003976C71B
MTAESDSSTSNGTSESRTALSAVPDGLRPTVQMLIVQIEAASKQLKTLQAENERLRARVAELEQRPEIPESALVLPLEEADADTLAENLDAYIETIDVLLENLPDPDSAADTSPSA